MTNNYMKKYRSSLVTGEVKTTIGHCYVITRTAKREGADNASAAKDVAQQQLLGASCVHKSKLTHSHFGKPFGSIYEIQTCV